MRNTFTFIRTFNFSISRLVKWKCLWGRKRRGKTRRVKRFAGKKEVQEMFGRRKLYLCIGQSKNETEKLLKGLGRQTAESFLSDLPCSLALLLSCLQHPKENRWGAIYCYQWYQISILPASPRRSRLLVLHRRVNQPGHWEPWWQSRGDIEYFLGKIIVLNISPGGISPPRFQ